MLAACNMQETIFTFHGSILLWQKGGKIKKKSIAHSGMKLWNVHVTTLRRLKFKDLCILYAL